MIARFYRLPDMEGLDIMREILEMQPETGIVLISSDDSIRQKALDIGANAFRKKPADIKVITDTVNSLGNNLFK
jgi:DNA-binding NarL/FixJ family response regulator